MASALEVNATFSDDAEAVAYKRGSKLEVDITHDPKIQSLVIFSMDASPEAELLGSDCSIADFVLGEPGKFDRWLKDVLAWDEGGSSLAGDAEINILFRMKTVFGLTVDELHRATSREYEDLELQGLVYPAVDVPGFSETRSFTCRFSVRVKPSGLEKLQEFLKSVGEKKMSNAKKRDAAATRLATTALKVLKQDRVAGAADSRLVFMSQLQLDPSPLQIERKGGGEESLVLVPENLAVSVDVYRASDITGRKRVALNSRGFKVVDTTLKGWSAERLQEIRKKEGVPDEDELVSVTPGPVSIEGVFVDASDVVRARPGEFEFGFEQTARFEFGFSSGARFLYPFFVTGTVRALSGPEWNKIKGMAARLVGKSSAVKVEAAITALKPDRVASAIAVLRTSIEKWQYRWDPVNHYVKKSGRYLTFSVNEDEFEALQKLARYFKGKSEDFDKFAEFFLKAHGDPDYHTIIWEDHEDGSPRVTQIVAEGDTSFLGDDELFGKLLKMSGGSLKHLLQELAEVTRDERHLSVTRHIKIYEEKYFADDAEDDDDSWMYEPEERDEREETIEADETDLEEDDDGNLESLSDVIIRKTVEFLQGEGASEASSYPSYGNGQTWFEAHDNETREHIERGGETRKSFFLEDYTEEEGQAIYDEITK